VEQDRGTGYEFHTTIPTSFLTKVPKIYSEENTVSSTNVAGKSDYLSSRN
jgi:hypothetical protein